MLKGPLKFDAYQLAVDYGFHHQLMRNTLQLNRANGTFSDIGMMAGVAATDWSWRHCWQIWTTMAGRISL